MTSYNWGRSLGGPTESVTTVPTAQSKTFCNKMMGQGGAPNSNSAGSSMSGNRFPPNPGDEVHSNNSEAIRRMAAEFRLQQQLQQLKQQYGAMVPGGGGNISSSSNITLPSSLLNTTTTFPAPSAAAGGGGAQTPPLGGTGGAINPSSGSTIENEIIIRDKPRAIDNAVVFLNAVKEAFINEPSRYEMFISMLYAPKRTKRELNQILVDSIVLLKDHPNLFHEFKKQAGFTAAQANANSTTTATVAPTNLNGESEEPPPQQQSWPVNIGSPRRRIGSEELSREHNIPQPWSSNKRLKSSEDDGGGDDFDDDIVDGVEENKNFAEEFRAKLAEEMISNSALPEEKINSSNNNNTPNNSVYKKKEKRGVQTLLEFGINREEYKKLIETKERLDWIVENVPKAPEPKQLINTDRQFLIRIKKPYECFVDHCNSDYAVFQMKYPKLILKGYVCECRRLDVTWPYKCYVEHCNKDFDIFQKKYPKYNLHTFRCYCETAKLSV